MTRQIPSAGFHPLRHDRLLQEAAYPTVPMVGVTHV